MAATAYSLAADPCENVFNKVPHKAFNLEENTFFLGVDILKVKSFLKISSLDKILQRVDRELKFQEAQLLGVNLIREKLKGADFRYADLRRANLQWTDLRDANLTGVNLGEADLRRAQLQGAKLKNVDFKRAELYGADLRNTNVKGADFRETILIQTDLRGALYDSRTQFSRGFDPKKKEMIKSK